MPLSCVLPNLILLFIRPLSLCRLSFCRDPWRNLFTKNYTQIYLQIISTVSLDFQLHIFAQITLSDKSIQPANKNTSISGRNVCQWWWTDEKEMSNATVVADINAMFAAKSSASVCTARRGFGSLIYQSQPGLTICYSM